MVKNERIFTEATSILHEMYGNDAVFREGQYEAIEATILGKRTLVVERTGWGKSLVYFMCTRLNRTRGRGLTLVISPLLVLMSNQMEMAQRMGIRCAALNSTIRGKAERDAILKGMESNQLDMVFITPETLLKDEVQRCIPNIVIGLFVVDEAHCISDWGHDFRLDYGKLGRLIGGIFSSVPVLATTATANERVVADIKRQMGDEVAIFRGPLMRESLHIQVLHLETRAERYAWLLCNLRKIPGTGIIYCLDRRDCDYLAAFLSENGIPARAYYSRSSQDEEPLNDEAIESFGKNTIKAIVATIKLGMGYDKGDVGFVIHFQSPSSIVAWYQQIGRAGRNLKDAFVFLMHGQEDDDINDYFINTAFPGKQESRAIMDCILNADGVTKTEIVSHVNARLTRIDKALYFMESEGFIRREKVGSRSCYFATPKPYVFNEAHYREITMIRKQEMAQMHELIRTRDCLGRFTVNCLSDPQSEPCGQCANCLGHDILDGLTVTKSAMMQASAFLASNRLIIEPRKRWPENRLIPFQMVPGTCLSRLGDSGCGELVEKAIRENSPAFDESLVRLAAEQTRKQIRIYGITAVTFVPSLRQNRVRDFAERLARQTGLQFADLFEKREAPRQKEMENSAFQCANARESFSIRSGMDMPRNVLLVDDLVDSRWTLTVCAFKLMESGCQTVCPFALADCSKMEA